jgi:hypothetical protein
MKTKKMKQSAILLLLAALFSACEKEVVFTELPGINRPLQPLSDQPGCNIRYGYNDRVILINSNEDLDKYRVCTEADPPFIDFSRQSLLPASGGVNELIHEMHTALYKNMFGKHTLEVKIVKGVYQSMTEWGIAVLTPKIPDNSKIELDLRIHAPFD